MVENPPQDLGRRSDGVHGLHPVGGVDAEERLGLGAVDLEAAADHLLASVVGAGLAMFMLWATVKYGVVGFLSSTLTDTAFIGVADVFSVAPAIVLGVVVLTTVTSWVTLRRYLRV